MSLVAPVLNKYVALRTTTVHRELYRCFSAIRETTLKVPVLQLVWTVQMVATVEEHRPQTHAPTVITVRMIIYIHALQVLGWKVPLEHLRQPLVQLAKLVMAAVCQTPSLIVHQDSTAVDQHTQEDQTEALKMAVCVCLGHIVRSDQTQLVSVQ